MQNFGNILLYVGAGIAVALLFGLAVFIHEFGHYLAARCLGLRVDVFSIGFGPAIVKWRRNGIEYRVCWIPLGGYVALPQLDPSGMDKIQGGHASGDEGDGYLPAIPAWRRVLVALAGPLGNFVLAVALAWIIFLLPSGNSTGPDITVGDVKPGSAAADAGFATGDRIVDVNGTPVASWNDFVVECHLSGDLTNGVRVLVERGGDRIPLSAKVSQDDGLKTLRIDGLSRMARCIVGDFTADSPAARAGLAKGDVIAAVNGERLTSPSHMVALVSGAGEEPLELTVLRGGETLGIAVAPRYDQELGRHVIGIIFADPDAGSSPWLVYRNPWRQLKADAGSITRILRALFAPKAKGEAKRAANALGGPVMIFFLLWNQVMAGLANSLAFLRFLCVNLAILNLLPLPVLDGGHILFALWEIVTRRKPHPRFIEIVTNAFAILLIGLMILLVSRDVLNLHRVFKAHPPANAGAVPADGAEAVSSEGTESLPAENQPVDEPAQ